MTTLRRLCRAAVPAAAASTLAILAPAAHANGGPNGSPMNDLFSAIAAGDFSAIGAIDGVQFLGAFQGKANLSASSCADPADNGPAASTVTVLVASVTDPHDGTFTVGFGLVTPDDARDTGIAVFDLSGINLAGGPVSGSLTLFDEFDDDDGGSIGGGSVSGSVSGNALNLSINFSEDPPSSCIFSGSALLRRVDLAAAATANATPTDVIVSQNMLNNTRAVTSAVGARIQVALRGRAGGASRVGNAFRYDLGPGLSAGDGIAYDLPFGVWASYTRAGFEDDFAATAFQGDRNLALGGFDFAPFDNALLGLSLGWEGTGTDTRFNRGRVDSDGIIVSPYFAYAWSDHWQIDALFGYTSTTFDQARNTLGGLRVSSSTQSDRFFWGGNFTGSQTYGNLYVAARFGLLWMRENVDAFTESNGNEVAANSVNLSQWRFGGDAAYFLDNGFEPFASVTYERDFARDPIRRGIVLPGDDEDGFVMAAGMRFYHDSGLTGSLEWNGILGRSAYSENAYTVYLRKQF